MAKSTSLYDAIRLMGCSRPTGGTYTHVRSKVIRWGIDTSHFQHRPTFPPSRKVSASDILVLRRPSLKGRRESLTNLRNAMLEVGVPQVCGLCKMGPQWNGQYLQHHVDHINGDPTDNRQGNLRYLCPNCHTQTPNYAGKGSSYRKSCPCGALILKCSSHCNACKSSESSYKNLPTPTPKIEWPTAEVLKEDVWSRPATSIARDLGVSSNAVKKHCRKLGITLPGRGYWQKQESSRLRDSEPKVFCIKCDSPLRGKGKTGHCRSCFNSSDEKREMLRRKVTGTVVL